jgi:hypothetical protein
LTLGHTTLGVRQFGHTKINGVRLFGHPKISDDLSVTKGRFLRVGRPTTFIGARFPHRLTPTLPFGAFVNEEEVVPPMPPGANRWDGLILLEERARRACFLLACAERQEKERPIRGNECNERNLGIEWNVDVALL